MVDRRQEQSHLEGTLNSHGFINCPEILVTITLSLFIIWEKDCSLDCNRGECVVVEAAVLLVV